MVQWIAEVTNQPTDRVRTRLRNEFDHPGTTVRNALRQAGVTPYQWSADLEQFYSTTDAFLYELVIWNRNRIKIQMRHATARHIARHRPNASVLSIGDGLGFDSAHLAKNGHRITYFELPGLTESFARRVFSRQNETITVLTEPTKIPHESFDAIVCLDVLEHVPDPPEFVRMLATYLKPGGRLLVHAPFMIVQPSCSTHLSSNRRYSGDITLYERNGFQCVDGELAWNPIVLERTDAPLPFIRRWRPRQWLLRIAPCFMSLGRSSATPFFWADRLRMLNDRWFVGEKRGRESF